MDNLKSNLYSLAFLATHIKTSVYTLDETIKNIKKLDEIKFSDNHLKTMKYSDSLRISLTRQSIILFCSFLDEYNNFSKKHIGIQYSERINSVKFKNQYGIDRIKKWGNLYEYRNQVAAHNFDIKQGRSVKKSILKNDYIKTYNIPDTLLEQILFYKIVRKICNNIFDEFIEIRDHFDFDFNLNSKINIQNNKINLEQELSLIDENM
jgi:hypothetical protein